MLPASLCRRPEDRPRQVDGPEHVPFAGKDGSDTPDYATIQTSLTLLLAKEPPAATYPQWDRFLQQAVAAAKANDKARA